MKKLFVLLLLLCSITAYSETHVYLGVNALQFLFNGICINGELLFEDLGLTGQYVTLSNANYAASGFELGAKYYFQGYKGFNLQAAVSSSTYSGTIIGTIYSAVVRAGWRYLPGKDTLSNSGLALDVGIGFGVGLNYSLVGPVAVLGLGYQL